MKMAILILTALIMVALSACNKEDLQMVNSPDSPNEATADVMADIESFEVDEVSGEIIRHLDQEPEEPFAEVQLVGFKIFNDIGFTSQQQGIIFSVIQSFFTEHYPEMRRLSFVQGSIFYNAAEEDVTYFDLAADTDEVFRVKLDIESSIFRVAVYIYDAEGNLLN